MRHWRNEKGLTLLEIVIAMIILVTAIVPMFNMLELGTNYYKTSADQTLALSLAQGIMEEQLAKSFESLQSQGPTPYPDFVGYQYEIIVNPDPGNKYLKQVTVLLYQEENPQELQVELTTLVSER